MEPEGGDVLRDAYWRDSKDKLSDEEFKKRNADYLIRLELKLRELGLTVQDPTLSRPGYKLFAIKRVLKNRHPHQDYVSSIRVYVPATHGSFTVTCVVYDIVRMHMPRPGVNRMDECLAGHTAFTSTFSLDLCQAMIEEDYTEFVKIIEGVVTSRSPMSDMHHILGNPVDPKVFGLVNNSIWHE